jgi:hypothetical protein
MLGDSAFAAMPHKANRTSMRRNILVTLTAVGALCLGAAAILRGQAELGACFIGLGLLRAFMLLQSRRSRKPEPSIRLNLNEDDPVRSEGAEER